MTNHIRIALLLFGAFTFLLGACAVPSMSSSITTTGTGSKTASPAPQQQLTGGIGDTITFDSGGAAGTVILHTAEWATQGNSVLASTPRNGMFLVLDVEVTCTSGVVTANPMFWSAQDAEGRTYDADFMSFEGVIDGSEIPAGGHQRGYIAFDLPQGPVTVMLTPIVFGPAVSFQIA